MPKVRIIIGSKSDLEVCKAITETLNEFGVESDLYVSSAHRKPEQTRNWQVMQSGKASR